MRDHRQANNDRISSKRTVKQLEFGHGAPGTGALQELWVERFNAFRQHALKKSLDEPFCGDDVLRFFDSIISKMRPSKGKTGLGVSNDDQCFPRPVELWHLHLPESFRI